MSGLWNAEVRVKFSSPSMSMDTSAEGGQEGSDDWNDDRDECDDPNVIRWCSVAGFAGASEPAYTVLWVF